MAKLLNLTPVKSLDIVALRQIYECEVQIRSLEFLGVVTDTYLALVYTRKTGSGHELMVPELITFLQQEVDSRERVMHLTKTGSLDKDSQFTYQQFWKTDLENQTWHQPQHSTQTAQTLSKAVYSMIAQVINQNYVQVTQSACDRKG